MYTIEFEIQFKKLMEFFATPCFETCVPTLIKQLQHRYQDVSYVIPFDRTYDEDTLNGCYEQLEIVNECIKELSENHKGNIHKMQQFLHKKQCIQYEIESLLIQRSIKYAEWKQDVLKQGEEAIQIANKINELHAIENEFNKLFQVRYRKARGALMAAMFHNMVNTLLSLSSYKKENTPLLAFASAFKKGLIDAKVYNKLAKLA